MFPCIFNGILDVSWRFEYQHVGIQNASENARKMQEKRRKISQSEKTQDLSILHYALGKNASQLRFFTRFGTSEITKMQTQPQCNVAFRWYGN